MSMLEVDYGTVQELIEKLKRDMDFRKDFISALDRKAAEEELIKILPDIQASPFNSWDPYIHIEDVQRGRILNAKKVKIAFYDPVNKRADMIGSKKHIYSTTYEDCSCDDFRYKRLPCKHMYKLAAEYGGVNIFVLSR